MKKLGFGLMRLPLINEEKNEIDIKTLQELVDYYMQEGYNYFDTAYTYLNGKSEKAIKQVLTDKYPRNSFFLATKLPIFNLEKEEDMEEIFNEQLDRCGVEYFDYYLLHNVSSKHIDKFTKIDAFKFVKDKKEEGKIKHIGISLHDTPEFLENILIKHPEIEFVQLQINYLDWTDNIIQSKNLHDIACKYDKKVLIMEGLKGGALSNIPNEAKKLFYKYDKIKSAVSWSFRFNLSLENIMVILSGMNRMEDLKENIEIFENFTPLNKDEYMVLDEVRKIINSYSKIKCTSCKYCISHCPKNINIPYFFELYNSQKTLNQTHSLGMYYRNYTSQKDNNKASECIKCKKCLDSCPQKIDIPKELENVVKTFE